ARQAARGAHGAGDRASPLDHRARRPDPRHAQGRAAGGGHPPRAARPGRDLRASLPHAVRERAAAARAGRRADMSRWALFLALLVAGCTDPGYLVRAGWSEARLLLRRRPIPVLLARPDLDPALRERLELTLAVRDFAAHSLGLRVGGAYETFAEVPDDATV